MPNEAEPQQNSVPFTQTLCLLCDCLATTQSCTVQVQVSNYIHIVCFNKCCWIKAELEGSTRLYCDEGERRAAHPCCAVLRPVLYSKHGSGLLDGAVWGPGPSRLWRGCQSQLSRTGAKLPCNTPASGTLCGHSNGNEKTRAPHEDDSSSRRVIYFLSYSE